MRLVIISAWNDSGGGFLHRLFDGHPDLFAWPFELLFGRDDAQPDLLSPHWFHGRFRWARLHELLAIGASGSAFDALSDAELKGVLERRPGAKHLDYPIDVSLEGWRHETLARWSLGPARTQAAFLEAYIRVFADLIGAPLGDKPLVGHCPIAIIDAEEIFADFPDAKLIHVIRDPCAGFHDMRQRHPTLDPATYAAKWNLTNAAAALALAKRPGQVCVLTLSRLLENRGGAMRNLCEFVSVPFDEAVLAPAWRGIPLHEDAMGPFGGVPNLSLAREVALSERLGREEREVLRLATAGVAAVLERLDRRPLG